jgi:hypothetical protein
MFASEIQLSFNADAVRAARQPKTDRLILARLLNKAGADKKLDEARVTTAHDRRTLLPGHRSIAEHILDLYDELGGEEH